MIEVNKNTLAGAFGALGKLICRTSPLALCKSIKVLSEIFFHKIMGYEFEEKINTKGYAPEGINLTL